MISARTYKDEKNQLPEIILSEDRPLLVIQVPYQETDNLLGGETMKSSPVIGELAGTPVTTCFCLSNQLADCKIIWG